MHYCIDVSRLRLLCAAAALPPLQDTSLSVPPKTLLYFIACVDYCITQVCGSRMLLGTRVFFLHLKKKSSAAAQWVCLGRSYCALLAGLRMSLSGLEESLALSVLAEVVGRAVGGVVEAEEGEGDGVGPLAGLTIISCCLVAAKRETLHMSCGSQNRDSTHTSPPPHTFGTEHLPGSRTHVNHTITFLNTGCLEKAEDKTIPNFRR